MNCCWKYVPLIFLASCQCEDEKALSPETNVSPIQTSGEETSSEVISENSSNETFPSVIKKEQAKEALTQYFQTSNYPQSPIEYRACVVSVGCQAILKQTVQISKSSQSVNSYTMKPVETGSSQPHFSCYFGMAPDEVKDHEIFISMVVEGEFHAGWLCASEQINFESTQSEENSAEAVMNDTKIFESKKVTLTRGKIKRDYLVHSGPCPEGFSPANLKNPEDFKDLLCKTVRPFDVLKVGDHSTVSGSGYFCALVEKDASSPNLNLCVEEKFDLLQQKSQNLGKIGKKQFMISTDFDGCDTGFKIASKIDFGSLHKKICEILTDLNVSISLKDKTNLKAVDGQCLPTKDQSYSILCVEK